MNPECPPTMQGKTKQSPHHGYQRADTTYISSQNMASKTPSRANSKYSNTKDRKKVSTIWSADQHRQKRQRNSKSKNATRRSCQSTSMTHKNQHTMPKSVAWKQQHYLTQVPHSAAYQNISTTASVRQSHQGLCRTSYHSYFGIRR